MCERFLFVLFLCCHLYENFTTQILTFYHYPAFFLWAWFHFRISITVLKYNTYFQLEEHPCSESTTLPAYVAIVYSVVSHDKTLQITSGKHSICYDGKEDFKIYSPIGASPFSPCYVVKGVKKSSLTRILPF